MTRLRTKTLGAKLSEDEYRRLTEAAAQAGQKPGEWAREMMLAAAGGCRDPHSQTHPNPSKPTEAEEAVLAELLALRAIVLNLNYALARGEAPSAEAMQQIIQRADQDKERKARERLGERAPKRAREGAAA